MKFKSSQSAIAVVGASGKMGRVVVDMLIKEMPDYKIIKVNKAKPLKFSKALKLVIDFSTPGMTVSSAKFCASNNVPLIIGATGQTIAEMSQIQKAGESVPIVKAGNFSFGIAYMKQMLKLLVPLSPSDITVFERHHRHKIDSPSGTALELAGCIERDFKKTAVILSERGGEEIGTHCVDLYFGAEKISLSHQAFSRDAFASGALLSAKVLLKGLPPKFYNFAEILQIYQKTSHF